MELQWIGMAISLIGAWLVGATSASRRRLGFWCFLVSNTLWATFAVLIGAWGLFATQVLFTLTSVRGIKANRHEPGATGGAA